MRETKRKSMITTKWRKPPFDAVVVNWAGSMMQRSGIPDTLLITEGLHIWIEFKGSDTLVQPNQSKCHQEFQKQGIHVFIVRFVSDSLWLVDEQYQIKLRNIKFGAKLLFDVLLSLAKGGSQNVSQNFTPINGNGGR